jgi:hypothetical protein
MNPQICPADPDQAGTVCGYAVIQLRWPRSGQISITAGETNGREKIVNLHYERQKIIPLYPA